MASIAADRGGSFAHGVAAPRNWLRASAPGIATRCRPVESPSLGVGKRAARRTLAPARGTMRLALVALLVAAALACFGNGLHIYAKAALAQALLHHAWSRTQASGAAVKPWPWADTHPVARLIATGHDADVLVLAGASGRTLAFGPGHLDGSVEPGAPGNSVIVAHRDTHFRFLRDVAVGDEIVVEGRDGARRHFGVRRTYVADQRKLDIPREAAVPTITLVTCYPFDAINPGGPLRYVVVAQAR